MHKKKQAPLAIMNVVCDAGGTIFIGDRHVARVKGDELHRTLGNRELLFGNSVSFRRDVLNVAMRKGARRLVVTNRDTGDVLRLDMADLKAKGFAYEHKTFGRQWACRIVDFDRDGDAAKPDAEPAAQQMSMSI